MQPEIRIVAATQLETALRLYFEKQDYFSVVTLAGAADEIFGKMLTAQGVENSLDSLKKDVSAIHSLVHGTPLSPGIVAERANRARNDFKHGRQRGSEFEFDIAEEARDMLNRAVGNYWRLEEKLSPAMQRFYHERPELLEPLDLSE